MRASLYAVSKVKVLTPPRRPLSYIVINEARSGSSWLQEISQMHPGIKASLARTFETKLSSLRPSMLLNTSMLGE